MDPNVYIIKFKSSGRSVFIKIISNNDLLDGYLFYGNKDDMSLSRRDTVSDFLKYGIEYIDAVTVWCNQDTVSGLYESLGCHYDIKELTLFALSKVDYTINWGMPKNRPTWDSNSFEITVQIEIENKLTDGVLLQKSRMMGVIGSETIDQFIKYYFNEDYNHEFGFLCNTDTLWNLVDALKDKFYNVTCLEGLA